MTPRKVGIATRHLAKFQEFTRHFTAYGIDCEQLAETSNSGYDAKEFKQWLKKDPKKHIAVLQEHTDLLSITDRSIIIDATFDPTLHLMKVIHLSSMKAWTLTPVEHHITYKDYTNETEGYLDYGKSTLDARPSDCYDWDDIFVIPATGLSNYETAIQLGNKVSSRDKNIAAFIKDRIYYKELCDLTFDPVNMRQPVDFSIDPLPTLTQILPEFMSIYAADGQPHTNCITVHQPQNNGEVAAIDSKWQGIYENGYYPAISRPSTTTDPIKLLLHNTIIKCLNMGVFLRAPENRREKLYWVPGLNSGIPLTKKAEQGHERIFRFHDCSHHGIPDLVFISPGYKEFPIEPKLHKMAYVLHRLMTEAFSLVTADMLGTHYLQEEYGDYESAYKRKIIQVYCTLPALFRDAEHLIDLYYLIYHLVFYGELPTKFPVRNYSSNCKYMDVDYPRTDKPRADKATVAISEISAECSKAIGDFLAKYRTYFLDDFYWTVANYEDMLTRSAEFDELFKTSSGVVEPGSKPKTGYYPSTLLSHSNTINGFIGDLISGNSVSGQKIDDTVHLGDHIFIEMFYDNINETVDSEEPKVFDLFTPAIRTSIGFCRYMYGQSLIFKHFAFLSESARVYDLINKTMYDYFLKRWTQCPDKGDKTFTYQDMEDHARQFVRMIPRIRAIYTDYLDMLLARNLITQDDRDTYKEVYPIFKPVYVDYSDETFDTRLGKFNDFMAN